MFKGFFRILVLIYAFDIYYFMNIKWILFLFFASACLRADICRYRYETVERSGEPKFVVELPFTSFPSGPWYEVERDSLSRLVRVAGMRGATKENEVVCRYLGKSSFPSSADIYRFGEHTGLLKFQRDENGYRTRIDTFTANGELTGYLVRSYTREGVDEIHYSASGKIVIRFFYYYSDKDVLTHYCRYAGSACYEYFLDPATGVVNSLKKFKKDELVATSVYTHDKNGEMTREDVFNPNGTPFGFMEYSQGLIISKHFELNNGTTEESTINYDKMRRADKAEFYVNGKFICKFVYDYLSDGTVKRTIALGPKGDIWAEYPNREVNQVEKDGQASDSNGAILHRTGDWWYDSR